MPRFTYRATDAAGHEVTGDVTAERSEQAVANLMRLGYQVSWLTAAEAAPGAPARGLAAPEQVAFFNSQLAAMTKTGIPVSKAIAALAADMRHGRLRGALERVAKDLEDGQSLGQAFEAQRAFFPPAYGHLMEAGAKSGNLPGVLLMLSTYSRAVADLRRAVIAALWYPLIVIAFCVGIFTFMSFFIAPQLERIFKEFNMEVPWVTAGMLFLARNIIVVLAILAGLVALGWGILRWVRRSAGGRRSLDRFKLHLPLVGKMLRASLLSRFARTLGLLLYGGVPILEALRLTRLALGNAVFEDALGDVEKQVADGGPLGLALQAALAGGQVLGWAVHLGEQRGDLIQTLDDTAEVYDLETRYRAQTLKSAIAPLLVVLVALFVATTASTLLLPMIRLISHLGQGNM